MMWRNANKMAYFRWNASSCWWPLFRCPQKMLPVLGLHFLATHSVSRQRCNGGAWCKQMLKNDWKMLKIMRFCLKIFWNRYIKISIHLCRACVPLTEKRNSFPTLISVFVCLVEMSNYLTKPNCWIVKNILCECSIPQKGLK